MFYVKGCNLDGDYELVDYPSESITTVTVEELNNRVLSGEVIVGAKNIGGKVLVTPKGAFKRITIEDYAILSDQIWLIDSFNNADNGTTADRIIVERDKTKQKKYKWLCSEGHITEKSPKMIMSNSECKECTKYVPIDFETHCKQNPQYLYLLDEWADEEISPKDIAMGSNRPVKWRCPVGHIYEMRIPLRRNQGQGCNICSRGLQTSFPEQAMLYYLRQCGLNVESGYKFHGKHEIDIFLPDYNIGIEYDGAAWHSEEAQILADTSKSSIIIQGGIKLIRLREKGCPELNVDNCILLEVEYKDTANAIDILFQQLRTMGVDIGADVIIDLEADRHTILSGYRTLIAKRSIATTHPEVVLEWNFEKNVGIQPEMFSFGSGEKVWWLCKDCGYEWQASIGNRCTAKSGCPECAKNFDTWSKPRRIIDVLPDIKNFLEPNFEIDLDTEVLIRTTCLHVRCPECGVSEYRKNVGALIRRYNRLSCSNCNYSIPLLDIADEDYDSSMIKDKKTFKTHRVSLFASFPELETVWGTGNEHLDKDSLTLSTMETVNISCPKCGDTSPRKYFGSYVKRNEGVRCINPDCDFFLPWIKPKKAPFECTRENYDMEELKENTKPQKGQFMIQFFPKILDWWGENEMDILKMKALSGKTVNLICPYCSHKFHKGHIGVGYLERHLGIECPLCNYFEPVYNPDLDAEEYIGEKLGIPGFFF